MFNKKLVAFTLAEVLITIAILGVVAALTIPTVITNYRKKQYVTQLKKNYNNITNAFRAYMATEGVTDLTDTTLWSNLSKNYTYMDDVNRDETLKNEFLKIFKVRDKDFGENYTKYYKKKWVYLNGDEYEYSAHGVFFADGTFFYISFMNDVERVAQCNGKRCSSLSEFQKDRNTPTKFWNMIGVTYVDVNGIKEPNTFGRDIFKFYIGNDGNLYPEGGIDHVVWRGIRYQNAKTSSDYWKNNSKHGWDCVLSGHGQGCAARIMENGWKIDY